MSMKSMVVALLSFALGSSAFAMCQREAHPYDNPAGRMDSSMQTLAHQTGCPIDFDLNIAPRRQVRAIRGNFTPTEALSRTLQGTGWEAHETAQGLAVNRQDQLRVLTQVFALKQQVKWAVEDGLFTRTRGLLLTHQLEQTQTSVQEVARSQGFVSAAEMASYQRTINEVKMVVGNFIPLN